MSEQPEDSFHRTLNAAIERHTHHCPSCKSDRTLGAKNAQGHWYGRCTACGCRFWA